MLIVGNQVQRNSTCSLYFGDVTFWLCQISDNSKYFLHSLGLEITRLTCIYDPLGYAAPVTLQGKLFLRNFLSGTIDWDEPVTEELHRDWEAWCFSLAELKKLQIPRSYFTVSFMEAPSKKVHVFCDASKNAIAAVAYLVTTAEDQTKLVGFLIGKTKVAPSHGHTIPRLELCAAVLAVEIAEVVSYQLGLSHDNIHTDSRIVLGYINNKTRRFYIYVCING